MQSINFGLSINMLGDGMSGSRGGFCDRFVVFSMTDGRRMDFLSVEFGPKITCDSLFEAVDILCIIYGARSSVVANALLREIARYS